MNARTTDPITSHEAGASVAQFKHRHYKRIYEALKEHGPGTTFQIATWTGMTPWQVSKRMKELEAEVLVVRAIDVLGTSPSGRACTIWVAL